MRVVSLGGCTMSPREDYEVYLHNRAVTVEDMRNAFPFMRKWNKKEVQEYTRVNPVRYYMKTGMYSMHRLFGIVPVTIHHPGGPAPLWGDGNASDSEWTAVPARDSEGYAYAYLDPGDWDAPLVLAHGLTREDGERKARALAEVMA